MNKRILSFKEIAIRLVYNLSKVVSSVKNYIEHTNERSLIAQGTKMAPVHLKILTKRQESW